MVAIGEQSAAIWFLRGWQELEQRMEWKVLEGNMSCTHQFLWGGSQEVGSCGVGCQSSHICQEKMFKEELLLYQEHWPENGSRSIGVKCNEPRVAFVCEWNHWRTRGEVRKRRARKSWLLWWVDEKQISKNSYYPFQERPVIVLEGQCFWTWP